MLSKLFSIPSKIIDRKKSKSWKPFSKLILKGDGYDWVLSSILNEMKQVCNEIGIDSLEERYFHSIKNQCVYNLSKYDVLLNWRKCNHRVAFPYFHGNPKNDNNFKLMFDSIKKNHKEIDRIHVSHSLMEQMVLDTGIEKSKVFKIPISIDLNLFKHVDKISRDLSRKQLNIPESAVVIGSFQKDGIGWGKGLEAKLIKGPDIFLKTLKTVKKYIPNLFVLLTGPARGYVKKGLEKLSIPYKHLLLSDYNNICEYFHALDLYLITSREEGGPRAILESMASGIPLITTRVGQAVDIVKHNENGWMVDVEDVDDLAHWVQYVIEKKGLINNILKNGRKTAEENCYSAQLPLWNKFMHGFVDN